MAVNGRQRGAAVTDYLRSVSQADEGETDSDDDAPISAAARSDAGQGCDTAAATRGWSRIGGRWTRSRCRWWRLAMVDDGVEPCPCQLPALTSLS